MRYELIRLAQLVFALSLMFGAFLGGLAVGWWRWGRKAPMRRTAPDGSYRDPRSSSGGLFTPKERDDDAIVLTHPIFDTAAQSDDSRPKLDVPTFAAAPQIAAGSESSSSS